jgi:hypothetical protein
MKNNTLSYRAFAGVAAILIIVLYFLPVWWVALQSIQYPKSMYPKGIRINFKYNGVYNGCEGQKEREELSSSQEGANCLVEMNAINHFIGMYHIVQGVNADKTRKYPIYYVFNTKRDANGNEIIDEKTGEPVKVNVTPKALIRLDWIMHASPYIFAVFVLMVIAFIFTKKKVNAWLALIPALLPFYFLGVYIYYLYWYGHHLSMHGGGAFKGIKPFMPTVFGEGKVAQFTTTSYPYYGFFVALLLFILLIIAILLKKKSLKES